MEDVTSDGIKLFIASSSPYRVAHLEGKRRLLFLLTTCVCVLLLVFVYSIFVQPVKRCRSQQFTASPERKVLTPALPVKAVICILAAYSLRSKPEKRSLFCQMKQLKLWYFAKHTYAAFSAIYSQREI